MITIGLENEKTGRKAIVKVADFTNRLERKCYQRLGTRNDYLVYDESLPVFVLGRDLWRLCRYMLALNEDGSHALDVLIRKPDHPGDYLLYRVITDYPHDRDELRNWVTDVAPKVANHEHRIVVGKNHRGGVTVQDYQDALLKADVIEIHYDVAIALGFIPTEHTYFRSKDPGFLASVSVVMNNGVAQTRVAPIPKSKLEALYS